MIKVLKKIVKIIFCKLLYKVEFTGKDNIDFSKSHVIMANHVSGLDPIFIWSDIQNLSIMAKEELFKFKPLGYILGKIGAFPIARGKKDFGHVYHAVKVLKQNKPRNLLIFPEGTRKAHKKNIKAKNGATYIAIASESTVIPVYISEEIKLFRKVKIEYKKPVTLNKIKNDENKKQLLNEETERIMNIIYSGEQDVR